MYQAGPRCGQDSWPCGGPGLIAGKWRGRARAFCRAMLVEMPQEPVPVCTESQNHGTARAGRELERSLVQFLWEGALDEIIEHPVRWQLGNLPWQGLYHHVSVFRSLVVLTIRKFMLCLVFSV